MQSACWMRQAPGWRHGHFLTVWQASVHCTPSWLTTRPIVRPATGTDRWFGIKTQIHSKLLNSLSPDQLRGILAGTRWHVVHVFDSDDTYVAIIEKTGG